MESSQLKTFWALFYKDVVAFKSDYWRVTFDGLFWSMFVLTPALFFLPAMGIPQDFGRFLLVVIPFVWGIFDITTHCTDLISDITGEKTIQYQLTLPIKQWLIFLKIGLANSYRSFVGSLFILPLGAFYIYMAKGLTLSAKGLGKYYLLLILANIFCGFFGLFITSFMSKVSDLRNIRMRIIFPMWFLAGFNNSWQLMHSVAPKMAYASLISPFVYIMEGARAALLGQGGFINYWICIIVIGVATVIIGVIGIKRLQKRLDCL